MRLVELLKVHEGKPIGHKRDSSSPERYLIHDRDPLFTAEFLQTLKAAGVKSIKLPPRSRKPRKPSDARVLRMLRLSGIVWYQLRHDTKRKAELDCIAVESLESGFGDLTGIPEGGEDE